MLFLAMDCAIAPKLIGKLFARAVSGNLVLDPSVVLVVFGLGAIGKHDRDIGELQDGQCKDKARAFVAVLEDVVLDHMLGYVGDLLKNVCKSIGRRLSKDRAKRAREHRLDAPALKLGSITRGIGRIDPSSCQQRAMQAHNGVGQALERPDFI